MAWVAVAIGSSAVLGAITSGIAGSQASDMASENLAAQERMSNQQLEFQQQQYADWQEVYGPVQQKLADFYGNLDAETLAASGLKEFEQQSQATQENMRRSFKQRGIESPAMDLLNQQAQLVTAEGKAAIRAEAPLRVAEAQQGFVSGGRANPFAGDIANTMGRQADRYGDRANQYSREAGEAYRGAGRAISSGVEGYIRHAGQPVVPETPGTPSDSGPTWT